jgi:sec-independent protein translocase protein TatA
MGSLSWMEILLIALLVLVLFGARKLPEVGKGLGEGIRSFRSALRGDDHDSRKEGSERNPPGAGS